MPLRATVTGNVTSRMRGMGGGLLSAARTAMLWERLAGVSAMGGRGKGFETEGMPVLCRGSDGRCTHGGRIRWPPPTTTTTNTRPAGLVYITWVTAAVQCAGARVCRTLHDGQRAHRCHTDRALHIRIRTTCRTRTAGRVGTRQGVGLAGAGTGGIGDEDSVTTRGRLPLTP